LWHPPGGVPGGRASETGLRATGCGKHVRCADMNSASSFVSARDPRGRAARAGARNVQPPDRPAWRIPARASVCVVARKRLLNRLAQTAGSTRWTFESARATVRPCCPVGPAGASPVEFIEQTSADLPDERGAEAVLPRPDWWSPRDRGPTRRSGQKEREARDQPATPRRDERRPPVSAIRTASAAAQGYSQRLCCGCPASSRRFG